MVLVGDLQKASSTPFRNCGPIIGRFTLTEVNISWAKVMPRDKPENRQNNVVKFNKDIKNDSHFHLTSFPSESLWRSYVHRRTWLTRFASHWLWPPVTCPGSGEASTSSWLLTHDDFCFNSQSLPFAARKTGQFQAHLSFVFQEGFAIMFHLLKDHWFSGLSLGLRSFSYFFIIFFIRIIFVKSEVEKEVSFTNCQTEKARTK